MFCRGREIESLKDRNRIHPVCDHPPRQASSTLSRLAAQLMSNTKYKDELPKKDLHKNY